MSSTNTIKSCAITICKGKSTIWRKVTENVFSKGQANNTLPSYIHVDDVICMNCYNGIVINSSIEFQRHAQEQYRFEEISEANKADNTNDFLSFSQAVKVLTDILYTHENREKKPTIYSFDEFREIMEGEDIRLKSFFDELYFSSSPSTKNKNSQIRVKKQLLFICFFLCGIRNKFVNNAKRDLTMYLDSTGVSNTTLDTLSDLGITVTSRSITRYKTDASKEHYGLVDTTLTQYIENAMVLNIDDYHNIHTERVPNTTTTSDVAHLATILMNPITTQRAIPQLNIHNSKLVDAESIKINLENRFMELYGLSHNQRWGFRAIDDNTRLEELTVHSYDIRLQEKRRTRSMKDVILIDLQKNTLHSLDEYVQAINAITNIPSMQQYIEKGNMIPIVADWPGQIYIRTAISRYLLNHNLSNITNSILSFLPIIGPLHISLNSRELIFLKYQPFFSFMYRYIFGERKILVEKPKPWRINLILEISRSAWQEILKIVEEKFGFCKDAEYFTLKDLLDNMIPLVLDIYAVFFRSGDFNTYFESCFRVWTIFLRFNRKNYTKAPLMFFSDIFYWESINHPILESIKAELPKFSDSTVEIFHSFLRRSTQEHDDAEQIIKYGHYLNKLRLDCNGFRENFVHTSTWASYEYSA
ncbi:10919_t:CDS:1 [Acaulospora morrowiae]|uniref:10919_t:CDS:1 n=1 Tax=Acaulospora morrowiae TaxID=94023 RepID=A0A9N9HKY9_9GLOM|nr:10919_t:CDS:1 [Acaulospora morrowiae]